jgi:hypothetical protein
MKRVKPPQGFSRKVKEREREKGKKMRGRKTGPGSWFAARLP